MESQKIENPLSSNEIESHKIVHEFMRESLSRIFKLLERKEDEKIKQKSPEKNLISSPKE